MLDRIRQAGREWADAIRNLFIFGAVVGVAAAIPERETLFERVGGPGEWVLVGILGAVTGGLTMVAVIALILGAIGAVEAAWTSLSRPHLVFGAGLVPILSVTGWWALQIAELHDDFNDRAADATAQVMGIRSCDNDEFPRCDVAVRFPTEAGSVDAIVTVEEGELEGVFDGTASVVPVVYDTDDTTDVRWERPDPRWNRGIAIGAFALAALAIPTALYLDRRSRMSWRSASEHRGISLLRR